MQKENEAFIEGGQEQGVNIVTPFLMLADEEGLYWFEILFEGRGVITRIPFRVIFATAQTIQLPTQEG